MTHFYIQGIKFKMVKQVTSRTFYAKVLKVSGREERVELSLSLSLMWMKEFAKEDWRHCLEVGLRLVNTDSGEEEQEMSGELLIQRFEVLRDCWRQLSKGLVEERD